jgi:hypothetical protein
VQGINEDFHIVEQSAIGKKAMATWSFAIYNIYQGQSVLLLMERLDA